jgi:serine/threonine protein phosphatase PrpC
MRRPSPRPAQLKAGVASDPGQRRTNNEDLAFVNEREGLFAVVDGVGGEVAGEEAARTAVDAIQFRFKDPGGDTEERIREAIALANNRIFQATQARPELTGMACVLTLAVIEGRTVTVGHVGDSRLYRIRAGRMEKITLDHSPIGEREDRGELTEAEAMSHPRRNEVYRDVGSEPHQPGDAGFIEIFRTSLPPDSAILICSDGLTDMVPREDILRIAEGFDKDPHRVAQELVNAANEAGGKDNITVVFIPGSDFASANGRSTTRRMGPVAAKGPRAAGATSRASGAAPAAIPATLQTASGAPPIQRSPTFLSPPPQISPLRRIPIWIPILAAVVVAAAALYLFRDRAPELGLHLGPAVLHVGKSQQYPSITAALADAHDGDSIVVAPGVYLENVLLKSGVEIKSAKPREAEILSRGTALNGQTVTGVRISGFRILPDSTNTLQIGLLARDSAIEIDDSELSGASDAGVVIQGNSTAKLSKNFIHENIKAGVRVESASVPDMQGNHICDNGLDIDPTSALAADANVTGPCSGKKESRKETSNPVKPGATEKPRPSGDSGAAHKGRRHE